MEGPGSFLFAERILRSYPSAGMHCALLQDVTFDGQLPHALEVNTIERSSFHVCSASLPANFTLRFYMRTRQLLRTHHLNWADFSWETNSSSKHSPNSLELENSSPRSQDLASRPYSESDQFSPRLRHPLSWRSILILFSHLRLGPFLQVSLPKYCTLLFPPLHVLHASPTSLIFHILLSLWQTFGFME